MTHSARILVAGAGPAGMMAALALAQAGFPVELVGPALQTADGRTTALMQPGLRFLDTIGVLAEVEASAAPLRVMRIVDATRRLVRSPTVVFRASEIGEDAFGLNVPNQILVSALEKAVENEVRIAWTRFMVERWELGEWGVAAVLADGSKIDAALAVAADGRHSSAREIAGIDITTTGHDQSALVLSFAHTRDHGSISTEFHTETGPFTQVPLPGRRSSLVWVVRPSEADVLMALADHELARRVEERMQSMLGEVTLEGGRQIYPLASARPTRYAANRVALIGEAAHVFPPIGAQGLNLGIRDIVDLAGTVTRFAADSGSAAALAEYDRRRRPDILARSGGVDLLNRSLLSDLLPAQLARAAGLGLLSRFASLRGFAMREGLRPGSGVATLFPRLEEIGRAPVRRAGSARFPEVAARGGKEDGIVKPVSRAT